MSNDKKYIEKLRHNLAVLQSYGTHYHGNVSGAVNLINAHHKREIQLSPDDLTKILDIAIRGLEKHHQILRLSEDERMNYVDHDVISE